MMFRVIGGAVVYGFALYGAAKFFDRPKLEVVIRPASGKRAGRKLDEAAADVAMDPGGGQSADVLDDAANPVESGRETVPQ